jgi:hypothetical protein
MKTYNYRSRSARILIAICLFLSGYAANHPSNANAQSDRASVAGPGFERPVDGAALLIIHRIPGLGNHVIVNLSIDGALVPSIMYGQTWAGLLMPGRHVLSLLPTPSPKWPTPSHMILDVRSGQSYNFTAMSDGSGKLILQGPGGPVRPRGR